jgi:flavin-binding protein dodecin
MSAGRRKLLGGIPALAVPILPAAARGAPSGNALLPLAVTLAAAPALPLTCPLCREDTPKPNKQATVSQTLASAGQWRKVMAVVKVIELLGESEESWEDATRQVVAEATKTLHGVTSVYVKEFQATVENDQVKNFRVNAKVSFVLERK